MSRQLPKGWKPLGNWMEGAFGGLSKLQRGRGRDGKEVPGSERHLAGTRKRKGAPLKVLVVDPNDADLEATAELLREAGFKVVSLSRLEAAVSLCGVFQPEAVVLATSGPDYAAVQVGRKLRQLSQGALPLYYVLDRPRVEEGHGRDRPQAG